jgi:hypothetical protein
MGAESLAKLFAAPSSKAKNTAQVGRKNKRCLK